MESKILSSSLTNGKKARHSHDEVLDETLSVWADEQKRAGVKVNRYHIYILVTIN